MEIHFVLRPSLSTIVGYIVFQHKKVKTMPFNLFIHIHAIYWTIECLEMRGLQCCSPVAAIIRSSCFAGETSTKDQHTTVFRWFTHNTRDANNYQSNKSNDLSASRPSATASASIICLGEICRQNNKKQTNFQREPGKCMNEQIIIELIRQMTNDNYYERSMIGIFHTCRKWCENFYYTSLPSSAVRLPSCNSCTGQYAEVEATNAVGTGASFPTIAWEDLARPQEDHWLSPEADCSMQRLICELWHVLWACRCLRICWDISTRQVAGTERIMGKW